VKLQKVNVSAKYDTQVLLNPSTDVIYPGSVLVGDSIEDGSYREVVRGRKNDITVSYGGLNGVLGKNGGPGVISGKIHPTLSGFRDFHNTVMSQRLNGASSTYTLQATDASTSDSFDVHFRAGVSFQAPVVTASIKGNFDYSKSATTNKYMIRFAQTFYTVDVDQGSSEFLYSAYALEDFEGVRPVYVSSVAYGRLAFITLESTESKETIAAGISAILQAPQLAVDASADTSVQAVQKSTNLNITVIGSDQVVTTLAGFKDFLVNGGFSATNTGQIVSYKLRFVDDNSVANVVYNGEYTLRSVSQSTGAWDVTVQADGVQFADSDGSRKQGMVDLMGKLRLTHGSDTYTLWDCIRDDICVYPDSATTFTDVLATDKEWGIPILATARFSASTLDEALRFQTLDLYDYNPSDKSVLYGPDDESFTIARAQTDGGFLTVTANRADGQPNKYVRFRFKVTATPVFR
jgi:thiol-activated cytolysin